MSTMPTMQTTHTMPRSYAEVLKTPWSPKEEPEKKQHVCLLVVLEKYLEAISTSYKSIDEVDDMSKCCYSNLKANSKPPHRGLRVEEEEEKGLWYDFTWC